MKLRLWKFCLALLSIAVFVSIGVVLETELGFPFYTTYRIACAGICLVLMAKIGAEYRAQRWPWVGFWIALLINAGLFFTPLLDRPASRGEIMFFALPDVTIFLAARAVSYPATDDHQRAVRQQLIVGLVLAIAVCAMVLSSALIPDRIAHRSERGHSG